MRHPTEQKDFVKKYKLTDAQFDKMMEIAERPISDTAVRNKVRKAFGKKIAKGFMAYIMY